ncbi:prephenate dehydrogenase (NADP(+)), partial [Lunasporangiospora selenospora]
GANGAYAEDAILELTSTHSSFTQFTFQTEGFDTMQELFSSIQRGIVSYGLIPIENSLSGTLHSVLELFVKQEPRLWVVGEYQVNESHYIMARPGTELSGKQTIPLPIISAFPFLAFSHPVIEPPLQLRPMQENTNL